MTEYIIPITSSGAFIDKSILDEKYITKIKKYFTIHVQSFTGYVTSTYCWRLNGRYLVLPRFSINDAFLVKLLSDNCPDICIDEQISKPDKLINLVHNIKLNTEQLKIKKRLDKIFTDIGGCILKLEAGRGKSYIAASCIKEKTLIVIHSTSMIDQWTKVISSSFNNIKIGYYYAKEKSDGDVIIAIVNSANSDEFILNDIHYTPIQFYALFELIIFDECHIYTSPSRCLMFNRGCQSSRMLGLSATPTHENNMHKIIEWNIGPIFDADTLTQTPQIDTVTFNAIIHKVVFNGCTEYTQRIYNDIKKANGVTTSTINTISTVKMLSNDPERNILIIQCINNCVKKGLYTFVFTELRNHADALCSLYNSGIVIDNDEDFNKYVTVKGGDKLSKLSDAEKNSTVIFTTYRYMGTGKSITKMNGLVLATPVRNKMEQYANRIFRLGSDTTVTRHIYDIVDNCTTLKSQWTTRNKYWNSKNYEIVIEKYDSKNI